MKIIQMHNFHASKGGAMEVLAHEGELLSSAGHDVTSLTIPAAGELTISPLRAGAKAVWNVEIARDLKDRINSLQPDVIHVHTPFPLMSPSIFRMANRFGVPAVATLHSYRYSCIAGTCFRDGAPCEDCVGKRLKLPGLRHRCYHDSLGASAAMTASLVLHRHIGTFDHGVDRFLALTSFSKRLLARDGVPTDKIMVKPNSVPDPGEPGHPVGDGSILYAGRLIDVKGIETLLSAWRRRRRRDSRLIIAGDGALKGVVEELAATDESVEYVGWLSELRVTELMDQADCVVVPSQWYEGLPLVILRSLSVGTPLIVSDLENFSEEVVADSAGVAFPMGDPAGLADAIDSVTADRPAWLSRRTAARQSYLRRYSPAKDIELLEQVYQLVIRERGLRSPGR